MLIFQYNPLSKAHWTSLLLPKLIIFTVPPPFYPPHMSHWSFPLSTPLPLHSTSILLKSIVFHYNSFQKHHQDVPFFTNLITFHITLTNSPPILFFFHGSHASLYRYIPPLLYTKWLNSIITKARKTSKTVHFWPKCFILTPTLTILSPSISWSLWPMDYFTVTFHLNYTSND